MRTVYAIPVSLYCAKLRILLRHKHLKWDEIPPPGGYGSAAYKEIVPSGNLPALRDGDILLGDSEAIAEYLNEAYPEPAMLPADAAERALVRERSRFHDTRLEPELRKLFPHINPANRDDEFLATQSQQLSQKLLQCAHLLAGQPQSLDNALTLGDCGFPITFTWIETMETVIGLPVSWPDGLRDYQARLGAIAAVRDELADYQPKLLKWLAESAQA